MSPVCLSTARKIGLAPAAPVPSNDGMGTVRAIVAAAISEDGAGPFSSGRRVNPEALRDVYRRLIEQEVSEEIAETILIEIAEELGPDVADPERDEDVLHQFALPFRQGARLDRDPL